MEQPTKKLDFLIQSIVKISHLETGIIEIQKKDVCVSDTLYASAVSSNNTKAGKKQMEIYVDCAEDFDDSYYHDSKWTEEAVFNLFQECS